MKDLFISCLSDSKVMQVDRDTLRKYFKLLRKEIGEDFQEAAEVSDECFDDVWFEIDELERGFITWH